MTSPSLQTLFLPLEQGLVEARTPVLFIGAGWYPAFSPLKSQITCWQPFFPAAAELSAHGFHMVDDLPVDGAYGLVLIDIPKQVEEAKFWLAHALKCVGKDGMIVACAANDANGKRLEGWFDSLGMASQSLSKNKAKVVWGATPATKPTILSEWLEFGGVQALSNEEGIGFISQPGLFGWSKIDQGSALLADNMIGPLKGVGADFGCGYGYLSQAILRKNPDITSLHLIDADSRALACAKENIKSVQGERTVQFRWADLSKPAASLEPLDFIVMNPPFHMGKLTESSLGQFFIKTARHHLKKGGKLLMVANAHLPYEKSLRESFSAVRLIIEKDGFKIYEAMA